MDESSKSKDESFRSKDESSKLEDKFDEEVKDVILSIEQKLNYKITSFSLVKNLYSAYLEYQNMYHNIVIDSLGIKFEAFLADEV